MPEKAKVFVAEDRTSYLTMIADSLEDAGHQLVLSASTLPQALKCIDQFQEFGVQIAVLDANLSSYDCSGNDGRTLAKEIRKLAPQVTTIGMSSSTVDGVHFNVGKMRVSKLGQIITDL